ncbi:serine-tRNA ligase [Spizellomyces punctatus DAOM BR117]|uniref:serine--tRNA ligase n=1 Tax=Spizellomyces punctatus (strain DAOM BR117) TaxID=645134 RepID=A0A0L0HCK6_SPIPD|nr:serine-tRNA ligase [Spizellomyces punctatus DAOM BR117]KNC98609.1 serine-tRNA ligase [Spizellomyces punctatus DAOM BR117]|eukprot:XP_016606649.1 serine-tRNA ligase [Spizellomyces punctatus DAOM BR117]
MIDINLLRVDKGGNPDVVRESQRKRGGGAKVALVDEVIALDDDWKKARFQADEVNRKINAIGNEIKNLAKAKKKDTPEWDQLQKRKAEAELEKVEANRISDDKEKILHQKLGLIGNLVHDSVIDSSDERNNGLIKSWWPEGRTENAEIEKRKALGGKDAKGVPGLYSHHEVLERIAGYDSQRGTNVAGHRGYFLTGPGVDLNLALIHYGLDFLEKRGYTKLWTPYFMKKDLMSKTAQLEEFDEALYKVGEGSSQSEVDGDEKYLIATSEQPISAFHAGEWFTEPEKELPKKYAGQSTCFRKEAGAHGRDTWGIFRVHQFEKVEQFVLTDPEKSWEMHEEMLATAEEFYQSLGLPYQVVSIVAGALNNAAAKKYDLEAWFPFQNEYKELVSCSNCTDYQSRCLEIRVGAKKLNDQTKKYVHCLNCTLTATERTICCILENWQTEEGVVVPPVLRQYMGGKEFFPFVKELPGGKKGGKGGKGADDLAKGVNKMTV